MDKATENRCESCLQLAAALRAATGVGGIDNAKMGICPHYFDCCYITKDRSEDVHQQLAAAQEEIGRLKGIIEHNTREYSFMLARLRDENWHLCHKGA